MIDFSAYQKELLLILRILIAGICGLLIGLERQNRSKEAGVRTHFMVAAGASLIMIVSKYAFFDLLTDTDIVSMGVKLDPSRIASSIVSGIGFLGAGMIFVHKNNVTGLTTAAGIWATAGVGMAIGAGMYIIGTITTLIIILAQIILHFKFRWNRTIVIKRIGIKDVDDNNFEEKISEIFKSKDINIIASSVEKNTENTLKNYAFSIEVPDSITDDEILSKINYNSKIKTEM